MASKIRYLFDTSAILFNGIEKFVMDNIHATEIFLIPEYILSEMENQANSGKVIGIEGLNRIRKIRTFALEKKVKTKIVGRKPTIEEIHLAKKGRIDALIKDLAKKENATLLTCDFVQFKSAEALGIDCIHLNQRKEKLFFERYIYSDTLEIHLKEGQRPKIKRGTIKKSKIFFDINTTLSRSKIEEIKKDIITAVRNDENAFFLINQNSTIIVKYKDMRISMFSPPFSQKEEITIILHTKTPLLSQYNINKRVLEIIKDEYSNILICGKKRSGKTTLSQAIGIYFNDKKKAVKTIERYRDMKIPTKISQYSFLKKDSKTSVNFALTAGAEVVILDNIETKEDFDAYRLLSNCGTKTICVMDAKKPIHALELLSEFIEPKKIPLLIDLIVFMEKGEVKKIQELNFLADENMLELNEF